ncbi:MAG: MMPL family transporter [Desulfobulbales bacterium]|nr:MMPL family transporter [Desulfobulbales bacterium]
MKINSIIGFSIRNPKTVTAALVVCTLLLASLMVKVRVDTDPENMLREDEPVRVFHNQVKEEFDLHDFVVLGVVNEQDPAGIFNVESLTRVHELTEFVRNMHAEDDPDKRVVSRNMIAPGTVDAIEQAGLGQVSFDWLMKSPPTDAEEVERIRQLAMNNPLLKGTLVSEDERAMGIYIPVSEKDFAAEVRLRLLGKIETYDKSNGDQFYITGLPVAEDTFGKEMFVQMAVSAPLAMLAIFLLMLVFFRQVKMIISPMIVAMMSVLCTMGLLIGTGNTLHIMSSMIPIFLMPIAVVDSIHILSEFFDNYRTIGDRRKTLEHVMGHLFMPMLYTSLTSAAGFASLALTPIPPVQAFGIFVAIGIMLAWLFTIVFVPAYIMLLKEESLAGFGVSKTTSGTIHRGLSAFLKWIGAFTYRRAKFILIMTLAVLVAAGYGIGMIRVNDNPVKWFSKDHSIRVADRVLNSHFGGTYEAYLVLDSEIEELDGAGAVDWFGQGLDRLTDEGVDQQVVDRARDVLAGESGAGSTATLLENLRTVWEDEMFAADDAGYESWGDVVNLLDRFSNRAQVFKRPEVLEYLRGLEEHLVENSEVGKSNSVVDVVRKVYQELYEGNEEYYRIPDSIGGVAETLITFQNSHKPEDLWHFVTPDYRKANLWIQLREGDNQVMQEVIDTVDRYFAANPPPVTLNHQWAGLTYLNVAWQDKMVFGMRDAFLGSFVIVFLMMTVLFRSPVWGLLAMVPLSVTIAFIYGLIGFIGKDYDMPVAILSSLTLGLAVDFAIHFLERSRATYRKTGSWKAAVGEMFEEPARAISRNVIVIAVGFTPLLAAPLVPYQTVGIFLASIMAISGFATILILPSLLTVFESSVFRKLKQ